MIERHVTFKVLPDKKTDFEKMFIEEYRPAMATMPGFQRADLLRQTDDPLQYQMVIRFDSPETAAAWRASARHEQLKPRLKALYSSSELLVLDVVA